jgi:spore coat protein U-like protein
MLNKVALAAVAVALMSGAAHAATLASSSFTVSATINPSCTVGTTTNIDFGTIGGTSVALLAPGNASVPVTCSAGLAYNIRVNTTNGTGGSFGMNSTTAQPLPMAYSLYYNNTNPTDEVLPGNLALPTAPVGSGVAQTYFFYARLKQNTTTSWPALTYTDTVLVTIEG